MSDTPKTDAAFKDANAEGRSVAYALGYMTEIARQFERENAKLREALLEVCNIDADFMTIERGTNLLRELGEVK